MLQNGFPNVIIINFEFVQPREAHDWSYIDATVWRFHAKGTYLMQMMAGQGLKWSLATQRQTK